MTIVTYGSNSLKQVSPMHTPITIINASEHKFLESSWMLNCSQGLTKNELNPELNPLLR